MDSIIEQIAEWLPLLAQVVGVFAIVATMTENDADNKIVKYLYKAINLLGGNFGKAKNGK